MRNSSGETRYEDVQVQKQVQGLVKSGRATQGIRDAGSDIGHGVRFRTASARFSVVRTIIHSMAGGFSRNGDTPSYDEEHLPFSENIKFAAQRALPSKGDAARRVPAGEPRGEVCN